MDGNIDDVKAHLPFCLRRGMHGKPPGVNSIRNILKIPPRRFRDFNLHIIHNYHNIVHNMIGGTMSTDYAANAPEFWFHHGFLDKIWYMWQLQSDDHKFVHFLQRNTTKMMGCGYTRRDYVDSHHLPKSIRVKYSSFPLPPHGKTNKKEEKKFTGGGNDKTNGSAKTDVGESTPNGNGDEENEKKRANTSYMGIRKPYMGIGKPYMGVGVSPDPIDDMGRTSDKFWSRYLLKRWDDVFPRCRPSSRDKRRAHKLHLEID